MNLARMMAAGHVSGAPAGYAWLVFSRASGYGRQRWRSDYRAYWRLGARSPWPCIN